MVEERKDGESPHLNATTGRDHGHTQEGSSWCNLLGELGPQGEIRGAQLGAVLGERSGLIANNDSGHYPDMLFDEHNCELYDNVHPIEWVDPANDQGKYDMLVIGGGAGGLVTAAGSRGVGARVALIERNFLGGDCLNTGCVPSKAFLKCANVVHTARTAEQYGIEIEGPINVNFKTIMERMRRIRAQISENDSGKRFAQTLGVDIYFGNAKFTGRNQVEVNGKTLTYQKACVATGGRPYVPDLEGIEQVPFNTSDNIFNLLVLPKKMVIVGGGPIGAELGQAFQRLGTEVTFVIRGDKFMPREDRDAAEILIEQLKADGCSFATNTNLQKIELLEAGDASTEKLPRMKLTVAEGEQSREMEIDSILFATGRAPNVTGMGLEEAGVDFDERNGIFANPKMQTTNSDIYTVGDCVAAAMSREESKTVKGTGPQFTHNSDVMARSVVRNALFFGGIDRRSFILPWATYTDPEIAHVGKYSWELDNEGVMYDTYRKPFTRSDRALCEGKKGFIKVHTKKGSDEILGATSVGGPAGELISILTAGMTNGLGLSKIGQGVYPYPTWAEGVKHLADQYNRTKVSGPVKNIIQGITSLRK